MVRLALIFVLAILAPTPVIAHGDAEVRRDVREARQMLRKKMTTQQFRCLHRLWEAESHWSVRSGARGLASGGAFGIPQALPGWKMASAGSDWRTNPRTQIRWGRNYIRHRYGTACRALSYQSRHGYY